MPHLYGKTAQWNVRPYSMLDFKKKLHSSILSGPRILGCIKEYVLRYEIQFRGSLHAHIILWIENSDFKHIANAIIITVPVVFDTTLKFFFEPTDPHQNRLFKESCENNCIHIVHDAITKKCRYL